MNGYINLIVFILTTVLYFWAIKPQPTFDSDKLILPSETGPLVIYILIILVTQFALNTWAIIEKCGGSASQNIGVAAFFTILPWTLIFGIVIAVLIIFPGFKTAFSDVVGYFYISEKAHVLFSELLAVKGDVQKIIQNADPDKKQALTLTADALIKLCGNMGILINQIVPSNFEDYWQLLQPLMKSQEELAKQPSYAQFLQDSASPLLPEVPAPAVEPSASPASSLVGGMSGGSTQSDFYKNELLKLVSSRDNVGEFMWYLYTGILVISIIQYYILSRGCLSDAATMEKNYQEFLKNEEAEREKEEAIQNNTTYTISS